MIIHRLDYFREKTIVLASQSPRRLEILKLLGLNPIVIPSAFDETLLDKTQFASPAAYVCKNAHCKVMNVVDILRERLLSVDDEEFGLDGGRVVDFIIGSDTVVVLTTGRILEKPRDEGDAFEMLSELSGKVHEVVTGVVIYDVKAQECRSFHESTRVQFADLSKEEIWAYIRTGEPMDKAGAYGIQGIGGALVKELHGDYFCVMGFPMHAFAAHLSEMTD